LLVAAAMMDARVRDFAASRQSSGRDRIADAIDPAGRAGVLIPALAISVGLPRLFGQRALSDRALRVTADYFAADAVESVLKPLIGRHRPSDAGGPWRFRPVQHDADWHSLPSAHVVHAFAIAAGIAHESESPAMGDAAYLLAGLVGVQRLYTGAHWSSDVVASALLANTVSSATDRFVRARFGRSNPRARASDSTSMHEPGVVGGGDVTYPSP
jgi:membrane-associated phospholipid phosphatase